ncbi:hypothetical protein P1X15_27530 [Runella sp. MFBS21]|uniref:hypothetical protein n=1 Tax=Runella sp. MFBS21 TaxID=3034018 RepID=UPI0023F962F4|nr:hypothetical protein [Runella sp. MFBS21]MDF7821406.1 hypothetical protein [Runella sp. MFBS21]
MKKYYYQKIITLLFLLGVISCNKDLESVISVPKNENITIDEARLWFDDMMKSSRLIGNDIERQVFWKYAYESKMDKNKKSAVIIVPITQARRGKILGLQQLWVYKNKNKEITMRIVEFLYDTNISHEQLGNYSFKNFTGAMLIREWGDNILGGIAYENGKAVAGLMDIGEIINGVKQLVKKPKNGRTSHYCYTTLSCYSGSTSSYGSTHYWTVCSTGLSCIWNYGFDQDQEPPAESSGYSDNSGGSAIGSEGVITYFKRFSEHTTPCDGFNQALAAQAAENKEMLGFITTDNKIIIMPNDANNQHDFTYTLGSISYDINNRPIVSTYPKDGGWGILVYYYQGPNTNSHVQHEYVIKGIFHTHPQEPNTDYDEPSSGPNKDYDTASHVPELAHYIVHANGLIKYNGTSVISRKRNWQNDCAGISSFLN